jgi:hypothetical protein
LHDDATFYLLTFYLLPGFAASSDSVKVEISAVGEIAKEKDRSLHAGNLASLPQDGN